MFMKTSGTDYIRLKVVSTEGDRGWTPQMQATVAATQNTVGQVGDNVEKRALWSTVGYRQEQYASSRTKRHTRYRVGVQTTGATVHCVPDLSWAGARAADHATVDSVADPKCLQSRVRKGRSRGGKIREVS